MFQRGVTFYNLPKGFFSEIASWRIIRNILTLEDSIKKYSLAFFSTAHCFEDFLRWFHFRGISSIFPQRLDMKVYLFLSYIPIHTRCRFWNFTEFKTNSCGRVQNIKIQAHLIIITSHFEPFNHHMWKDVLPSHSTNSQLSSVQHHCNWNAPLGTAPVLISMDISQISIPSSHSKHID